MSVNNFLPFCPTDIGTNLLSQADYAAATNRDNGNQPGVASSKLNNKALRQATYITSQIAQFISNVRTSDVLDDNTPAKLLAQITASLTIYAPILSVFTSGSGTFNPTYIFAIVTGSATVGATYTHNSFTYTVTGTVASGVEIKLSGTGAPLANGTLTKSTGTGDATLVFYAVRAPTHLKVRLAGAGGGGAGAGNAGAGNGAVGGTTAFGTSLLTAIGGDGANASGGAIGAGGTSTVNSPALALVSQAGGAGGYTGTTNNAGSNLYVPGGHGGMTPFFGGGGPSQSNGSYAGTANSGGGGSGGSLNNATGNYAGGGGGSGGFIEALLFSPLGSYNWAVGAGGTGGTAGTNGAAGANGGSGIIIVEQHFQ